MEQRIKEGFDSIQIPDKLSNRVEEALLHKKSKHLPLIVKIMLAVVTAVTILYCYNKKAGNG